MNNQYLDKTSKNAYYDGWMEFDCQRYLTNEKILNLIKSELDKKISFRFIQILFYLGILDKDEHGNIIDRVSEEPQDTLKRIEELNEK